MERLARTTGNTEQTVARQCCALQSRQTKTRPATPLALFSAGPAEDELEASLLTKQSHQAPRSLALRNSANPIGRSCTQPRGWQALRHCWSARFTR
jgi:hypothetical protein